MISNRSTVERRKYIMNEISRNGQVFVQQLSKKFKVSEVTVRNDLEQLERKRILIRARGGAIRYDGNMANEQLSKFFRKSLAFICGLDRINTVVTDDGISREDKQRLEDTDIKVIIA